MIIDVNKIEDTLKVQSVLLNLSEDLKKGKKYTCEIKQKFKKRSLDANNYSWYLQEEISKATNLPLSEVHYKMLMDYGVKETISIKSEVFESVSRMFEYYKVLGESEAKGTKFTHILVAFGTHNYNTKEMARFIDGVVEEAKNLGIQTETPEQLANMKSLWGSYEEQKK